MRFLIATGIILGCLALNHAVYGTGCWGFQPGGKNSMLLMLAQAIVSIYSLFYSARICFYETSKRNVIFLCIGVALGLAGFVLKTTVGAWMFTSVHHQGPENLIPFMVIALPPIIVGIQVMTSPHKRIVLMSDCPECGYPLKKLPHRVCPECGHISDEFAL